MSNDSRVNELLVTRASLMVATAKLVAHYVSTAVRAGTSPESINLVLLDTVESAQVSEIHVTDADGNIEFGSHPTLNFRIHTDLDARTRAAPFAQLLEGTASEGTATVVVQEPRPRELDGAIFQYVGVSGIVRSRIVQVGIAGEAYRTFVEQTLPWAARPECHRVGGSLEPPPHSIRALQQVPS